MVAVSGTRNTEHSSSRIVLLSGSFASKAKLIIQAVDLVHKKNNSSLALALFIMSQFKNSISTRNIEVKASQCKKHFK